MKGALLIACSVACLTLVGQDAQPWTIGVRGSWGMLAPHHQGMWFLVERHAVMGELFIEHPFSGAGDRHAPPRGMRWGIGLMATNAGSPGQLGYAARLLPYITLPIKQGDRFTLAARFGWGLGMVAEPFDRRDHFTQTAIGSRMNGAVLLAMEASRQVGRLSLGAGLSLDHFSNGAFQLPNLGINLVTANISVRYRLGDEPTMDKPSAPGEFNPYNEAWVIGAWGMQEVYPLETGKQQVAVINATLHRRFTPRSSAGVGVDLFNKNSLRIRDHELRDRSQLGLTQVAVHIGYAAWFGRLCVVIDQGFYLYSPIDENSFAWQRIGMRQKLGSRCLLGLTLKTHSATADHIELGIGYRIL